MNINMDELQGIFTILVAFGTALAPIVFGIIQLVKPILPEGSSKYLPLIVVALGGVIGALLVALAPQLGIEGLNYAAGTIGGLIAGFIATKQYDTGGKTTEDATK